MTSLKTPELGNSLFFTRSLSSANSTPRLRKKPRKLTFDTCAICEESLSILLDNEVRVELTCGDICHLNCLHLITPKNEDIKSVCPTCRKYTLCLEPDVRERFSQERLNNYSPVAYHTPEYSDLEIGLDSFSPYTPLLPNIMIKSDVLTRPNVELEFNTNDKGEDVMDCILKVESPTLFNSAAPMIDIELTRRIQENLAIILEPTIPNFSCSKTVIFDYLEVNLNGENYGKSRCFLSKSSLVVLALDDMVICQLAVDDICTLSQEEERSLVLNLLRSDLPEFELIGAWEILAKWKFYLEKLCQTEPDDILVPITQITSNAWDLLSEEIQKEKPILTDDQVNTTIPHSPLSVNLIICITVVNTSDMDDTLYRTSLVQILKEARASLRPNDKLGLICTGVDSEGKSSRLGTYTGCADALWDGWDIIINELTVFPNEINSNKIFTNNVQQLEIALNKCNKLLSFMTLDNQYGRVLFVNTCTLAEDSLITEAQVVTTLSKMCEKVSIDLASIKGNDTIAKRIVGKVAQGDFDSERGQFKKHIGGLYSHLFDSIVSFADELPEFFNKYYHNVYIPTISIEFSDNFKHLEIDNGHSLENVAKFEIQVHDIIPSFSVCFPFRFGINGNDLMYDCRWLNNKVLVANVIPNPREIVDTSHQEVT